MIKANEKDALAAFYRNKRIVAAYFRNAKIWEHLHSWLNGACSVCGKVCSHSWVNTTTSGTCSICGMTHTHSWDNDGYCTVCGYDGAAELSFNESHYVNLSAAENSITLDDSIVIPISGPGPYRIPPGNRKYTLKVYVTPPSNAIIDIYFVHEGPPSSHFTGSGTPWGVSGYTTQSRDSFSFSVSGNYTIAFQPYYKS